MQRQGKAAAVGEGQAQRPAYTRQRGRDGGLVAVEWDHLPFLPIDPSPSLLQRAAQGRGPGQDFGVVHSREQGTAAQGADVLRTGLAKQKG